MTTLQIPLPPRLSALYTNVRGKGRVKTGRYRTWQNAAGWDVSTQRPERVEGYVNVSYRVPWPKDWSLNPGSKNRKRDIANLEKALSDLLTEHGVIEDDSKIFQLLMTYKPRSQGNNVEVRIEATPRWVVEEVAA